MTQAQDGESGRTFERYYEVYKHAAQRWTLWLSLGNAGGLAAVASKITDKLDPAVTPVLLPSAWLFTVGLLATGGLGLSKRLRLDWTQRNYAAFQSGDTAVEKANNLALGLEYTLEGVAVAALVLGLLIPLLQISSRYELALPI